MLPPTKKQKHYKHLLIECNFTLLLKGKFNHLLMMPFQTRQNVRTTLFNMVKLNGDQISTMS